MPIIIDNFFVNNSIPIDNRCVVGTASTGQASFYSNKDLIQWKYPGLRIWDLNNGTPYVWTGVTWSSENTVGVTVDNTTSTGYIPKFNGTTLLGNSMIYETASFGNVGIGITPLSISPTIPGIANPTNGLHVSGNIKTNNKFIGIGSYITDLNASNINSGTLTINRISTLFSSGGSTTTGSSYVLQNTGTTVEWVLSSGLAVNLSTNSANIAITSEDTSTSTHYINFTQGFSGYNILKASPNKLKYNPSTGTVFSTNIDLTGNLKVKNYLSIGSNSLSSTLGSQVSHIKLTTTTANADYLEITNTRVSTLNPNEWYSAGYRIQQKVDLTYMGYIQFNGNNNGGISFGTGLSTVSATSISERFKIDESGNSFFTGNVQVGGNVKVVGNGTFGTGYISLTSLESGEMKLENVGTSIDGILKRLRSSWYTENFDYNIYRGGGTNITKATFSHNNGTILTLEPGGIRVLNYAYIGTTLSVGTSATINNDLTISSLAGTGTRNIAVNSSGRVVTTKTWTINRGFVIHGDVNAYPSGHTYTIGGDMTYAIKRGTINSGEVVTVTMNDMGTTNYDIIISIESLCSPNVDTGAGSFQLNNDIKPVVWRKISSTKFEYYIEETGSGEQNIKFHFYIYSLD